jgi:mycothiol synthase
MPGTDDSNNPLAYPVSGLVAGLPLGYASRPLALEDVSAVYGLEAAGEMFDDGVVEVDMADLEADWLRPDFDPATMSVGVFGAGSLVAYSQVFQGRAEGLVHPAHRGKGIGGLLARWTWEVARSEGRDRVGQTISENEHAAEALFRAYGYEATHTSWILRTELGPNAASSPALPAGYRFRTYRPGDDDREVFVVIDAAFDEWRQPGSESMGFDNWVVWALHDAEPGLIVLVEHGDHIVGVAVGHDYGPDAEGWIEQVAVEKAHRGRGLGRALLEESFHRFWEIGRKQCGVSTDSRTGALSLYEHVGMTVRRSYKRWTKTVL